MLHLRARFYSAGTGTFLSVDPIESEHPYLYVRGNPINLIDPFGLQSPTETPTPGNPLYQPTEVSVPDRPTPTATATSVPWPDCKTPLGSDDLPIPPPECRPPPPPPSPPNNDCDCIEAGVARIKITYAGAIGPPAEIIVLPPGTPPAVGSWKNKNIATALSGLGVVGDAVELGTLMAPILPQIPAAADTVVGFGASIFAGESYFLQRPHPCLPLMTILGQDAIVPAADLIIASGSELVGETIGTFPGYIAAKEIDAALTVAGGYYDLRRLSDEVREPLEQLTGGIIPLAPIPTVVATGVSWEDGIPHIVYLIYEQ